MTGLTAYRAVVRLGPGAKLILMAIVADRGIGVLHGLGGPELPVGIGVRPVKAETDQLLRYGDNPGYPENGYQQYHQYGPGPLQMCHLLKIPVLLFPENVVS